VVIILPLMLRATEWLSSYRWCYVRLGGYRSTAYVTCGWVFIILPSLHDRCSVHTTYGPLAEYPNSGIS
jgi:hypothetical protein